MTDGWLPRVALAGVASACVAFVGSVAVVADPSGAEPLYVAFTAWPLLAAALTAVSVEPWRLPRFAAVFCGSLVGLTLLFGAVADYRMLEAALAGVPGAGLTLAVNPVMAVLVCGALVLSYYGVFRCGGSVNDERPA
jgi:hypothetical protein